MAWTDWVKMIGGGVAAPFTGGATLPMALQGAGGVLGGMAKGSADERGNVNTFNLSRDKTAADIYGNKQRATLDALLAGGKDKMTGYQTQQDATLAGLRGKQDAVSQALANQSGEKLALAKLGLDAPKALAQQSVLGSLMKNMQPHSFTSPAGQMGHLTTVKGGMSPAALDPLTRQQGDALLQQALEKQLSGGGAPGATDFLGGIQNWDKAVLDVPEATDYSKGIIESPELAKYKQAGKGESWLSGLSSALNLAGAVGGAFAKKGAPETEEEPQLGY